MSCCQSLARLGLIRAVGALLTEIIQGVALDTRMMVALVLFLWVSTFGSAFLESLPYTTTISYILMDMEAKDELGIPGEAMLLANRFEVIVCVCCSNAFGVGALCWGLHGRDWLYHGLLRWGTTCTPLHVFHQESGRC